MIDPATPLEDVFYTDYYGVRWTAPGETRVVTWSVTTGMLDVPGIGFVPTTGDPTPSIDEFERAFQFWDEALASVEFRRTEGGNDADITLAITDVDGRGGIWGFWNSIWFGTRVEEASIQFDRADIGRVSVVTIAMHEIGNVLGLGDIRPSSSIRSVQEDPIPETFADDRLWADDIGLIRRVYDEDPGAPLGRAVYGTAADDGLAGGTGNDTVDGGAGRDTLSLGGGIDGYSVVVNANGTVSVSDRGQGVTGTDILTAIEALAFATGNDVATNGTLDIGQLTGVVRLSEAEIATFVEMYVAYFDRAPDAIGLYYWGTRLADGMSLDDIAESFFDQPETRARYPDDMENSELVREAYRNFLERDPDQAGWDYWTAELDAGFSRGKFMLALIGGARGNDDPEARVDVATIEAKADIGLHYAAIHGLSDVEDARTVMQTYARGDAASLSEAMRLTDAYAEASLNGPGEAFTMALAGVVDDPSAGLV